MGTDPFDNITKPEKGGNVEIGQPTFVELIWAKECETAPAIGKNVPDVAMSLNKVAFGKDCINAFDDSPTPEPVFTAAPPTEINKYDISKNNHDYKLSAAKIKNDALSNSIRDLINNDYMTSRDQLLSYNVQLYASSTNSANYNRDADWNPAGGTQDSNVTSVGSNGGPSAYGTYDQTGNVYEWCDRIVISQTSFNSPLVRGGSHRDDAQFLSSLNRAGMSPEREYNTIGFRIASRIWPDNPQEINPLNLPYFVTVGDIGNNGDTVDGNTGNTTGYGKVDHLYAIGQYTVTNHEYAQFLNAVASNDTHQLYNVSMGPPRDDISGGITRNGSPGNYSYAVRPKMANKPVVYVSWYDCARYCNWLHNGRPTGSQNSSTTEDGAYTLNGKTSTTDGLDIPAKNTGAKYHIPTEDEWYKAAYFKRGITNNETSGTGEGIGFAPSAVLVTKSGYVDIPEGANIAKIWAVGAGSFYVWKGYGGGPGGGIASSTWPLLLPTAEGPYKLFVNISSNADVVYRSPSEAGEIIYSMNATGAQYLPGGSDLERNIGPTVSVARGGMGGGELGDWGGAAGNSISDIVIRDEVSCGRRKSALSKELQYALELAGQRSTEECYDIPTLGSGAGVNQIGSVFKAGYGGGGISRSSGIVAEGGSAAVIILFTTQNNTSTTIPQPQGEKFQIAQIITETELPFSEIAIPEGCTTIKAWAIEGGRDVWDLPALSERGGAAGQVVVKTWLKASPNTISVRIIKNRTDYIASGSVLITYNNSSLASPHFSNMGLGAAAASPDKMVLGMPGDSKGTGGIIRGGGIGSAKIIQSLPRTVAGNFDGLTEAVALAGGKIVEDGGPVPAFGSGGGVTFGPLNGNEIRAYNAGYGGGGAKAPFANDGIARPIAKAGDPAVVLLFTGYTPVIQASTVNSEYWLYATQSDSLPSSITANSEGDGPIATSYSIGSSSSVNCDRLANWNNSVFGNITTVGSNGGPSAYGTYDQDGNVFEWHDYTTEVLESTISVPTQPTIRALQRGLRGGACDTPLSLLTRASRFQSILNGDFNVGFRVASKFINPNPSDLPDFVTVGDTNNTQDLNGLGSVAYPYAIGKFAVTNCEYANFLNSVARTDTFNLYDTRMGQPSNVFGGIIRSGSSGNYRYELVKDMGNKPVVYVNWFACARYCNWLHNGKPTGPQNRSTTEDGAYTMNGSTPVNVNINAKYHIPNENEWYKAAYYRKGSANAGYWGYATQTNVIPVPVTANIVGDGIINGNPANITQYACPQPSATGVVLFGMFRMKGGGVVYNPCQPDVIIEDVVDGLSVNEKQSIALPNSTGGEWSLSWRYAGTTQSVTIPYGATAAVVRNRFGSLSITGGRTNLDVTGSGTSQDPYVIEFVNELAAANHRMISVDVSSLTGTSDSYIDRIVDGTSNEQKTITNTNSSTRSFTVTFSGVSSQSIPYNASLNQITSILEGMSNIGVGNITVEGNTSDRGAAYRGPYRLIFIGDYSGQNVSDMTVQPSPDYNIVTNWNGGAGGGANEQQRININAKSGTYRLTLSNPTDQTSGWALRTAPASSWSSIAYGNGLFVAVATMQPGVSNPVGIMTSPDGITWTARTVPQPNAWVSVTFGNGLFVAVSTTGQNRIMTSPNGITWTARNAPAQNQWTSVTYGNGLFVAVATSLGEGLPSERVMTSVDGITWTLRVASETSEWFDVCYGNGLFVAVGYAVLNKSVLRIMTSPNGITWTTREVNYAWRSVASSSDGSKLVAVVDDGQIYTSTDSGVTWTARESKRRWSSVASSSDGTKLVAVVAGGRIYTSTDSGATWIARESNRDWVSVASSSDGTKLVAVVPWSFNNIIPGGIFTSIDSGVSWTAIESSTNRNWISVASSSDGTKLIAVTYGGGGTDSIGQIWTSTDSGLTWTQRNFGGNSPWISVASSDDGSKLVLAQKVGSIYTSTDSGVTWTARESIRQWSSVASSGDGTKLVAVVNDGQIYTSTDSGVTWTARESNRDWRSVASSGDGTKLVAVVNDGQIYTSTDSGVTWTAKRIAPEWGRSVVYGDGLFVAVGSSVVTSPDGIKWTERTLGGTSISVTYGNGLYVATKYDGINVASSIVAVSADGVTWTDSQTPFGGWFAITYGNGLFVAVSIDGKVMTSAQPMDIPDNQNTPVSQITTAAINHNATAAQIKTAIISSTPWLTANDITVTQISRDEQQGAYRFMLEFTGQYARQNIPLAQLDNSNLRGSAAVVTELQEGYGVRDQQLLTVVRANSGTYRLIITVRGTRYTTIPIQWNVTTNGLRDVINALPPFDDGDVVITERPLTDEQQNYRYLISFRRVFGDIPTIEPLFVNTLSCNPAAIPKVPEPPYAYPLPECDSQEISFDYDDGPLLCHPGEGDTPIDATPCCDPANMPNSANISTRIKVERELFDPNRNYTIKQLATVKGLSPQEYTPYIRSGTDIIETTFETQALTKMSIILVHNRLNSLEGINRILRQIDANNILPSRFVWPIS